MKETKRKTNARNDCDMENICLVSYQNGKKKAERTLLIEQKSEKALKFKSEKKIDK